MWKCLTTAPSRRRLAQSSAPAQGEQFHLSSATLFCLREARTGKEPSGYLEAAALLKRAGSSSSCCLPGEGRTKSMPAPCTRRGLLEPCVFGTIRTRRCWRTLCRKRALLFPMQNISAGIVEREAGCRVTPSLVIAGSVPSALITDGVDGLTCGDTAESMADAIEQYLRSPEDMLEMRARVPGIAPVPWDDVLARVSARYEALAGMERLSLRRKRGIFRKEIGEGRSHARKARHGPDLEIFNAGYAAPLRLCASSPESRVPATDRFRPASALHAGGNGRFLPERSTHCWIRSMPTPRAGPGDHDRKKRDRHCRSELGRPTTAACHTSFIR